MEPTSLSLGDQFARLHDAVQAQERCVFIPAAIHALIIACLTRLFGSLEQLVRLWQAGQLPAQPTRLHIARLRTARPHAPTEAHETSRPTDRRPRRRLGTRILAKAPHAAAKPPNRHSPIPTTGHPPRTSPVAARATPPARCRRSPRKRA